ncbi:MAG: PAS domain S-box protein, partial [Desulfobaccales bacterium]
MDNPDEILDDLRIVPPENLTPGEAARLIEELRRELRQHQQAEEALHTQALVLECMAEGVAVTDQQGQIIFTNPAFDAMFGYERGELAGRPSSCLNAYPPAENLRFVKEILRSLAAADAWFGEFHNQKKDGSRFVTSARISVLKMEGKKFYISVQEDVTKRKMTQAALEESEARYRSLVDLSPDAIVVHAKGRYVFANPAALKLFGAAGPQEIIGRRVLDLVHPDSIETVRRRVQAGERLDLREVKVLRLDGQPVAVEVAATPITYYGQAAIQAVVRDISRRKEAEKEIHRMASFPEGNPNPVLEVSAKGEVVYANPAARHMMEQLGLTGGVTAFLPPNLPEIFTAVRNGGPSQYLYDLTIDDHVYAVNLSFPPDLPTARVYAMDITERKEAEKALRRAHNELEVRVAARTVDLRLANEQLLWEIEERQQVEERLRDSETRFAAFMEHLPGFAVMRDIEGRYLFANHVWEEVIGFPEGAWRQKTLDEVWPPRQAAALHALDFQVTSSGKPMEKLEKLVLADGDHYFLTHRFPIRDKEGLPYMIGVIAIDVTARHQAEVALAEHAALVQDLYNNAPCGYHSLDREGTLVQINDTELAWLGYSREEVVGRLKFTDLLTPASMVIFQENFPDFKTRGLAKDLEYEMIRKDSTILPVLLSATAITDEAGNYVMSRSTIFDIIDRK